MKSCLKFLRKFEVLNPEGLTNNEREEILSLIINSDDTKQKDVITALELLCQVKEQREPRTQKIGLRFGLVWIFEQDRKFCPTCEGAFFLGECFTTLKKAVNFLMQFDEVAKDHLVSSNYLDNEWNPIFSIAKKGPKTWKIYFLNQGKAEEIEETETKAQAITEAQKLMILSTRKAI